MLDSYVTAGLYIRRAGKYWWAQSGLFTSQVERSYIDIMNYQASEKYKSFSLQIVGKHLTYI